MSIIGGLMMDINGEFAKNGENGRKRLRPGGADERRDAGQVRAVLATPVVSTEARSAEWRDLPSTIRGLSWRGGPSTTRRSARDDGGSSGPDQRRDAGQGLAFHPFEEGAARGRDVGELVLDARGGQRCDRVAAARDRQQRALF